MLYNMRKECSRMSFGVPGAATYATNVEMTPVSAILILYAAEKSVSRGPSKQEKFIRVYRVNTCNKVSKERVVFWGSGGKTGANCWDRNWRPSFCSQNIS